MHQVALPAIRFSYTRHGIHESNSRLLVIRTRTLEERHRFPMIRNINKLPGLKIFFLNSFVEISNPIRFIIMISNSKGKVRAYGNASLWVKASKYHCPSMNSSAGGLPSLCGCKMNQQKFFAGWIVDTALSVMRIVFAARTCHPSTRSRPGNAVLIMTAAIFAATFYLS